MILRPKTQKLMDILDQREEMKKLDKSNMLASVEALANQCVDAWDETQKIEIPEDYKNISKIAVFGMGGSTLGAHVIKALCSDTLKAPIEIINDYEIPAWVDENTLAILSSYSGGTEETVAAGEKILERTQKVLTITAGSRLLELAKANNWPTYEIDPKYNPCGQPRMAVGYSIVGQLGLLAKAGILDINKEDIEKGVRVIGEKTELYKVESMEGNLVKDIVRSVHGKIPLFFASEHLAGNAHIVSNQTNENAKNFATYFLIPELNHHLMEGLKNPAEAARIFAPVLFTSNLYYERTQTRHEVTKDVLKQNGMEPLEVKLGAETKFEQMFEMLTFGGFFAFYLSMKNDLNPSPIPWVDYFKEQLTKA